MSIFHPNAYILAVASPTTKNSDPSREGWFLSDFFALNAVLRGVGSQQTWLMVADINKIIERHGELLHGNPFREPRVVLSQGLLDSGKITPPTRIKLGRLTDEFLKRAGELSTQARRENVPLILFLFCHGNQSPTYELFLDGPKSAGLRPLQLMGVLEPAAKVVVITTSCYSGGWMIASNFNRTMASAASHDQESITWPFHEPVGLSGSVFVSAFIQTLTSTASPLIGINETTAGDTKQPLQPARATPYQTSTYNAFCRTVWDSCMNLTRLWEIPHFSFGCADDRWSFSWSRETGLPLYDDGKNWRDLPVRPYTGEPTALDQDPRSTSSSVAPGLVGHGGVRQVVRDNLVSGNVQLLASIFANFTCPGDWDLGQNGAYLAVLLSCAKGARPSIAPPVDDSSDEEGSWIDEIDVYASILYRWELANFVEFILTKFKLAKPNEQDCLLWDLVQWDKYLYSHQEDEIIDSDVRDMLREGGFPCKTTEAQGPDFVRPTKYLAAAIVEAKLDHEPRKKLIEEILAFVQEVEQSEKARMAANIVQDPGVQSRAKSWLSALGRTMRSQSSTPQDRRPCAEAKDSTEA